MVNNAQYLPKRRYVTYSGPLEEEEKNEEEKNNNAHR
jgi:hypothetical protein